MIHHTAAVDDGAYIGLGTKVWHWTHVRGLARIGNSCVIGQNCYIDAGVVIGDRCKVQNGVSVYNGVTLEDDVFVGPNVTFTNDPWPRAMGAWDVVPTLVRKGASLGANATILCGVVIGEGAMVGAGAVVCHDVPPYALVVGSPAHVIDPDVRLRGETRA